MLCVTMAIVLAKELTNTIVETETDGMENIYLNLCVGQGIYGLEIRYVLQIVGMQEISAMPEMPMYMKGLINLRGSIIPVMSMRERFGLYDDAPYSERTCIVIVQVGDDRIGLMVDAIEETTAIMPNQISPRPRGLLGASSEYMIGVAQFGAGNKSVLIDVQKLFDISQIGQSGLENI